MNNTIDRWLLVGGKRYHSLDGLRFVAISLVLLFHLNHNFLEKVYRSGTPLYNTFPNILRVLANFGWVGVHIFFTLSGFLIGGIIYRQFLKNEFSFRKFYFNRSLRIFPAFYFFLIITSFGEVGFNWATLFNFGYITNYAGSAFHDHIWSLNVEEHYYLFFPLLFFVLYQKYHARQKDLLKSFTILILLLWLSRIFFVYQFGVKHIAQSHLQIDFLFLGVLGALLYENDLIPQKRWLSWVMLLLPLGYVPLAMISPASIKVATPFYYSFYYPLVGLWCFGLVVLGVTQRNLLTKILSISAFRWIAVLSYSMYLYHTVVISFFLKIFRHFTLMKSDSAVNIALVDLVTNNPVLATLLGYTLLYACTLFLAILSFMCVERPFLILRNRYKLSLH